MSFREYSIDSKWYIVYFPTQGRADMMQAFHSRLSDMERALKALQGKIFGLDPDRMHTAMSATGDLARYNDWKAFRGSFTYRLRHNAIQARTGRMGFFILFTNTMLGANEILRKYRGKDVMEKAFMHSRRSMQPLYARTEEGTRAKIFLSILEYTMMRIDLLFLFNSEFLRHSDHRFPGNPAGVPALLWTPPYILLTI